MTGRPGFFGGIRQGDAPERDAEFSLAGLGERSQFVRLGELTATMTGNGGSSGFDPVWGTLGSPAAQGGDSWQTPLEDAEAGPIVDVEILGDGFQIDGRICTGQFPRLSDWLNMQQGFIQVQDASVSHLGRGNMPDADHQKGALWVRLSQIVMVAERSAASGPRPGAPVVQKERHKVTIVTPGYSLRGNLHVHMYGSIKQFLDTSDPHFIPITDMLVRWTSDPTLVSRFPFGLVNREQMISLLDEPTASDGESANAGDADAEIPLHRRWGAA
jgi:hypothetical protein